ncbi:MAG: hypothetical protein JSS04_11835 [Proteobacteria bacterium]|nr:hypothetical protein [Pseudomonadota bacterium]
MLDLLLPAKPAFQPSAFSGLVADYDPGQLARLTFNGAKVASLGNAWAPGTPAALAQATSALQPLFIGAACNGRAALQFDATTYIKAAFTLAQPCTVLLVARSDSFVTSKNFCDGGTTGDSMDVLTTTNAGGGAGPNRVGMYAGANYANPQTIIDGTWYVICAVFNGASSFLEVSGVQGAAANAGSGTPGGLSLGAGPTGLFALACSIARACVWNTALTSAQVSEAVRRARAQYRI